MRLLEHQLAGWEDDEWYDLLVALHGAAGCVRRAAALPADAPPSPVPDEVLDFLVGLVGCAANVERWLDELAAAAPPPRAEPAAGPVERLLR